MADVADIHQNRLKSIKKNVETAYLYFKDNYDRYNEYRKFVFDTSMSSDDIALLKEIQKPQLEFNICEAYISRLRGEFSKQEPSISVRRADGTNHVEDGTVKVIEGYLRAILFDANRDGMEYDVYTDILSGGFSTIEIYTDYSNEMSFDQNIYLKRVFDPTLCGFDPLAIKSHKGDGRYCFKLHPMTKEEFEESYGKELTAKMRFTRELQGFSWSYQSDMEDIIMICEYYEKKKKKVQIVELAPAANGQKYPNMTVKQYKKFLAKWEEAGIIDQPPVVIRGPRQTEVETICRYTMVENKILEYVETDFKSFPLIFVDGNSIMLRNGLSGAVHQMTRPYIYHAKGVQKLKNFAGQTLANELENMVMHKFMVPKDGIPAEYTDAYMNVQKASVLVYNQYKDNDPGIPLNPPSVIQRTATPPEVSGTFRLSDEVTQLILGSFDGDLGKMPSNAMSGIAIQEMATLGNAAAMPYIVGFLKAFNQAAAMIVDLIPKYYVTPRTIPVMTSDGKREYKKINNPQDPNSISMRYDANALDVKVEAGVNFAIQKSRALQQIIALMQASPVFAQFMNQEGLGILLDNVEIRGIDQLITESETFMNQLKQKEQMAQQMQMMQMQEMKKSGMQNPEMMKIKLEEAKLQQKQQEMVLDMKLKQQQFAVDEKKAENERIKILAGIAETQGDQAVEEAKTQAHNFATESELAMKKASTAHEIAREHADLHHRHRKENLELAHQLSRELGEQNEE